MENDKVAAAQIAGAGLAAEGVGFVLNAVTSILGWPALAHALALVICFGAAAVVLGCLRLAIAKGHPWFFGLLGLFSFVGVAILWFGLKDRPTA